jgi:chromosome partitioning protein
MRKIACLAWKGGVAKTTTALELSAGIVQRLPKARVVLADLDPQSNATLIMLEKSAAAPTLADVLLDQADAAEAIRETRIPRLDILPADGRLADCTAVLADEKLLGRERRLSIALESLGKRYDYCVIDSPGQLTILTVNILQAVDDVVSPVDPGTFGVAALYRLEETIDRVRHYLQHPKLALVSCPIVKATKNSVTAEHERKLRARYKSLISKAVIPSSPVVEEAHSKYRTVLEWAPRSSVAKAYDELVTEVLAHGRSKRVAGKRARRRGSAA